MATWEEIYKKRKKAKWKTTCGVGSSLNSTEEVRKELPLILKKYDIKSIIDIPCGDFYWASLINFEEVEYIGFDIVEEMINDNKIRYPNFNFYVLDAISSIPPKSDLILCRDFLFHISDEDILIALENFKNSGAKYLLTTNFPKIKKNRNTAEVSHKDRRGFRRMNLTLEPFGLDSPIYNIQEKQNSACQGRTVSLFCLS